MEEDKKFRDLKTNKEIIEAAKKHGVIYFYT